MNTELSGPAIYVRELGKRYRIGGRGSGSLYDRVGGLAGRRSAPAEEGDTQLWALRDISFTVPSGQVLGVLGRNGSGKSTLMKMLARVTAPTEGFAIVHGRVGALLQVGTGFHPELTGRDNIALSGAILGMSRHEIDGVYGQIVDFAEIGRFLDTPVKHYSTGMYLRLAFSVAAHMRAEIMLVDEVLSVGDAAFQRKCQDRIRALVSDGRTILFVSHNMSAIQATCDSAIVLHRGHLEFAGTASDAVDHYARQFAREAPIAV